MSERVRMHCLSIALCALSGVAATLLLGAIVQTYGALRREKMLTMVAYGLGTIVFPFSTVLFAHEPVALLVLVCFALARGSPLPRSWSLRTRAILLGLVGAFAIVSEYPSGIIVGILAVVLVLRNRASWRDVVLGGLAGAAPILVVHSLYLHAAFGSPLSMPYGHVFEPMFRIHHEQGFLGINPPTLGGLYGVTVSQYRGLLFLCPHLLLAVFGLAYWIRDADQDRDDRRTVIAVILAYLCFNASYYAWDGGGSTGPRHYIPALAFLSIPFFFFIRRSALHFALGAVLTAVSMFFMFVSTAVLVHMPEGEVMRSSPLWDVAITSFFRGELALNPQDIHTLGPRFDAAYNLGMFAGLRGLGSLVPLLVLWVAAYAIPWRRAATAS